MKITDEMVEAARRNWAEGHDDMEQTLRAALATQPDLYRAGFEKAKKMAAVFADDAADLCIMQQDTASARSLKSFAAAICAMEMPDE